MIPKRLIRLPPVSPSLSQYPINPDEKEEENRIVVKKFPTRGNGGRFTYYENNKVPYSRNKPPLPQTAPTSLRLVSVDGDFSAQTLTSQCITYISLHKPHLPITSTVQ